ncbi:unnamed protein product [Blepharisma stoltei]|uniref:CAF1B/HIR1 beta-propeller domain-containing protein n=1 Tax=Blepharisma stoltei TaxID=1481888 RepID=A0AAU9ID46_9CILI|nr:unnamed protein product [Blepharisma stoltei]
MRVILPEIFWHGNRERIMSLDFQSSSTPQLATCGADLVLGIYIRIWQINLFNNELIPQHIDDLAGTHERCVNVVKFSPDGKLLASGSDDGCVVIWEKKLKPVFGEDREEIGWGSKRVLRGHVGEIHDLCWSETGKYIATASMDGSAIIFDVERAKVIQRLEGHKHVQGISWHSGYLATMSTDRTLRIFKQSKKGFYIKHSVRDYEKNKLFQEQGQASAFFRRLAFSPCGSLLIAPAGLSGDIPVAHCFFKKQFTVPSITFPINITNQEKASAVCVKFCPFFYKANDTQLIAGLEHKLVWAVATKDSVLIYDSEHATPIGAITNAHYAPLTDLAWFGDKLLAVSSIDGYVSFVVFEEGELGIRITAEVKEEKSQDMEIEEEVEVKDDSSKKDTGKRRICPVAVVGN